jgi:hypothetical protein
MPEIRSAEEKAIPFASRYGYEVRRPATNVQVKIGELGKIKRPAFRYHLN